MLIAKIKDNQVIDIADYKSMFPNTSFSANGIDDNFLAENSCLRVTVWKPYNEVSEKLVVCTPYIQDNQVFTVKVGTKTQEELDADVAYVLANNKAARAEAYRNESDPLFFKAQRNEISMDEWIAKVNEIKIRYPDPTF